MNAISFDLDGVLALWPLGVNPGISSRPRKVAPLPADAAKRYDERTSDSPLRLFVERLRFAWRVPDPDAMDVLRALSERHRIVVTTGRSAAGLPALEAWLERHGLRPYVHDLYLSPKTLSTRQHKLATLQRLGIDTHVDDDPTTIWYLHENGVARPVLRSWPKTERTELPSSVARIRRLPELLEIVG